MTREAKREKQIARHAAYKAAKKALAFSPDLTGISGSKLNFLARKMTQGK